jgi:hypothetical protein
MKKNIPFEREFDHSNSEKYSDENRVQFPSLGSED